MTTTATNATTTTITEQPLCLSANTVTEWLECLESDNSFSLVENRPWANQLNRRRVGCIAEDYVLYQPKLIFKFYWSQKYQLLAGTVEFTELAEGPPGGAHGASIATVFDEILAYPVWCNNLTAYTANLTIQYKSMIPIKSIIPFTARIINRDARKITVYGELFNLTGNSNNNNKLLYSTCTGLWISTDKIGSISRLEYLKSNL